VPRHTRAPANSSAFGDVDLQRARHRRHHSRAMQLPRIAPFWLFPTDVGNAVWRVAPVR
jgi:hypothetical protein